MNPPSSLELRADQYADRYHLRLVDRLGSGKDGTVWATDARSALKVFEKVDPFRRELAVYRRLAVNGVDDLCGHAVPQLLECDEELAAIEMSVVKRPYVLDFASALMDGEEAGLPDYAIAEQHEQLREWFGADLPKVAAIVARLQRFGIQLVDINPRNIAFAETDEA